jgi:hypothetical protein
MESKGANFSTALEGLKKGEKVKRMSWGLDDPRYVFLQEGAALDGVDETGEVIPVVVSDNLVIRLQDGKTFEPYIPTTSDLLADDWVGTTAPGVNWDAWDDWPNEGEIKPF